MMKTGTRSNILFMMQMGRYSGIANGNMMKVETKLRFPLWIVLGKYQQDTVK